MQSPLPLALVGAPIVTSADPNGTAPGSLTTWTTPPHAQSDETPSALVLELVDGTSATVELWLWVQGTEWALLGTVTLSAVHQVSTPVGIFDGATTIYPRVTAVAGSPTTIRAGFTQPLPGAATAGSSATKPLFVNSVVASTSTDAGTTLSLGDTSSHAFASKACAMGALVSCPQANTAPCYVAFATGVTTATGLEIVPGNVVFLPVSNLSQIFAITGTATQVVRALPL